jgi:hypothetical protein
MFSVFTMLVDMWNRPELTISLIESAAAGVML